MGDVGEDDLETIRGILADVQLGQFFPRIRDDLQVTRLSHFDYVRPEDLENIGLGKPAARRLLETVKKKRSATWRRNLVSKILSTGISPSGKNKNAAAASDIQNSSLTCLIQEKVDGIEIPGTTRTELIRETDPSKALIILRMLCSGHLPLGKNLLKNPSGADGLSHWSVVHGGDGLIIESPPCGTVPIPEEAQLSTQHCFVSSYGLCRRQQVIGLQGLRLTPMVLKKLKPKFIISEWVSARWDCRSESKLCVEFIGRKITKTVKLEWSSDDENVVQNEWYEVKETVTDYPADLYKIVYTNVSKDRQFWAGHYGAKTAGSSVKLVL